jgi:hypothetical protein
LREDAVTKRKKNEAGTLPAVYLRVSRLGPLALCALGLGMVLYAMFVHRPTTLLITSMILGIGTFIAGVVLPRVEGDVEVGTRGMKAGVVSARAFEGAMKLAVAATAETVAENTIPDEQADKQAQVDRQVRLLLDALTLWLGQQDNTSAFELWLAEHNVTVDQVKRWVEERNKFEELLQQPDREKPPEDSTAEPDQHWNVSRFRLHRFEYQPLDHIDPDVVATYQRFIRKLKRLQKAQAEGSSEKEGD